MRRATSLIAAAGAAAAASLGGAACGGRSLPVPDMPEEPLVPTANPARGITETRLSLDATALTGTATITFAGSDQPGATLEVGDLAIERIRIQADGADLAYTIAPGRIHLALPRGAEPIPVVITYRWKYHEQRGASSRGYTLVWPYFCSNLFPCHSDPADGTAFSLEVTGVPAGKTAVFSATLTEAPSYQIAWSIDDYVETALGATTAGTQLAVWHRAGDAAKAQQGTAQLVAAFDWLERTIGPYRFGPKAGTVAVAWGPGALGGIEHHPFWHVGTAALGDVETNVHEAAHGWFGDGIRIKCWEDFVLSEGTVTYLAGRALDVVAPAVGAAVWTTYEQQLAGIPGAAKVWPASCGVVDVIQDDLFTRAPYIRGAFFFRAVALKVGAGALDAALRAFYAARAGTAASMADMLATIRDVTGYDPAVCADRWLRSTSTPAPGPCP